MEKTTKQKWDKWELIAIKYLKSKDFEIIDTNFKFWRFWENEAFWLPEDSITKAKLKKFRKTIEFYVLQNNLDFEKIFFEVITILKWKTSYKLKHYKNLEI